MKRYKAFISHSHHDKALAHWLKVRLEKFNNRKISSLKYPLREVFLDYYNIGIGPLKEKALKGNLEISDYLILLCSSNLVKDDGTIASQYVQYEIEQFKAICQERGLNWKEYILPIAVGNPIEKVLPNEVKDVNTVQFGHRWQILKNEKTLSVIIAKLLGKANPDEIWHYLRRRTLVQYAILLSLSLLFLLLGFVYWDFHRTRSEYYTDYISGIYLKEKNLDWASGIGKMTEVETKRVPEHYRFEYKRIPIGFPNWGKWHLVRIVHANAYGYPVDFDEQPYEIHRYPIEEIQYQSIGKMYRPESIHYFDIHNRIKLIAKLSGESLNRVDFQNFQTEKAFMGQTLPEDTFGIYAILGNKYANITHYDLKRDSAGRIVWINFKADNNYESLAAYDSHQHTGLHFVLDSIGRISYCQYLKANNELHYVSAYLYDNYLLRLRTYGDEHGAISSTEYWREKNILIKRISYPDRKSFRIVCKELKNGLIVSQVNLVGEYSATGNPTKLQLIDSLCYQYNSEGYPIQICYYDNKKQPSRNEYIKYTNKLYTKEISYRNPNTMVFIDSPEGFCHVVYEYNKNDDVAKSEYTKKNGTVFCVEYQYDAANRLVSTIYKDKKGKLSNISLNYVDFVDKFERESYNLYHQHKHQNADHLVGDTLLYYGHKFVMHDNVAQRNIDYDLRGNVVSVSYLDSIGNCFYAINEEVQEDGTTTYWRANLISTKGEKLILNQACFREGVVHHDDILYNWIELQGK